MAEGEIDVREGVGATGDSLLARLAVPDTGGVTLDGVLAAEGAGVTGVLRDFDLLHLLTEGGAITDVLVSDCSWSMERSSRREVWSSMFEGDCVPGTVFTGNSDLWEMLLAHVLKSAHSAPWRLARRY